MRRKHPYLLVEVLIAFALSVLCCAPLLYSQTKVLRQVREDERCFHRQRVFQLACAEAVEQFLKGKDLAPSSYSIPLSHRMESWQPATSLHITPWPEGKRQTLTLEIGLQGEKRTYKFLFEGPS